MVDLFRHPPYQSARTLRARQRPHHEQDEPSPEGLEAQVATPRCLIERQFATRTRFEAHASELGAGGEAPCCWQRVGPDWEVMTGEGMVEVSAPRIDERREVALQLGDLGVFHAQVTQGDRVLPILYLHGLSTGDFALALVVLRGRGQVVRCERRSAHRGLPAEPRRWDLSGSTTCTCGSTGWRGATESPPGSGMRSGAPDQGPGAVGPGARDDGALDISGPLCSKSSPRSASTAAGHVTANVLHARPSAWTAGPKTPSPRSCRHCCAAALQMVGGFPTVTRRLNVLSCWRLKTSPGALEQPANQSHRRRQLA